MTRVLFICQTGRNRGPTASQIFADRPGLSTDFGAADAGAADAVNADQLDWAEVIFVMDRRARARLDARFGRALTGKAMVSLDVPGCYTFMQGELVDLLMERAGPHLT